MAAVRDNNTNFLTALRLLDLSVGQSPVFAQAGAEGEAPARSLPSMVQDLDRVPTQRNVLPFQQDSVRDQQRERTIGIASRDVRPRQATSLASRHEWSDLRDAGILDLESVLNDLAFDVAGAWTKAD